MFWGSVELPFDFVALWEHARTACGLKHESLAALMGISSQQLSQQLHGQGHPSVRRMCLLLADPDGRRFFAAFVGLTLDRSEAIDPVEVFLEQQLSQRKRMAKASFTRGNEERRIA